MILILTFDTSLFQRVTADWAENAEKSENRKMRANAEERLVRAWVAKIGPATEWIEHAKGGTIGIPDCLISYSKDGGITYSGMLGSELKCWIETKSGFLSAKMRREQVRYHYKKAQIGCPTVIIVGVSGRAGVYVLQGADAPRTISCRMPLNAFAFYGANDQVRFYDDVCAGKFDRTVRRESFGD